MGAKPSSLNELIGCAIVGKLTITNRSGVRSDLPAPLLHGLWCVVAHVHHVRRRLPHPSARTPAEVKKSSCSWVEHG